MIRKNYPGIYKWAYATSRENELISVQEQKLIPKQTKSNWRKLSAAEIHLLEEELQIRNQLEELYQKQDLAWYKKKRLFNKIARLNFQVIDLVGHEKYLKLLGHNKKEFVGIIEEYSEFIPKKKLLNWFKLSNNRYATWYSQVNFNCKSSKLKLCAKQHPYQITSNEFKTIESCLLDPYYDNWPKSAIHSNLLKLGKITISRSTFYKHAQQIMPSKERRKSRKKGYRPLRASYVNEYWHMDISYFNTDNNQRSFIYAIIDNYSRKIIAWKCEQVISKIHIGSVINEALQLTSLTQLNLVTDGGKENVNHYIQNLIMQYYQQSGIDIEHKIALKTIQQSNSMIERFFRIMKSNYLYFNVPYSHQELCLALEKIIHEYNFLRPHYALNHLTPAECFDGKKFPDISKRIKRARKQRFKKNKNCNCTLCICDEPD